MDLHLKSKDAIDEPLAPVLKCAVHASIAVLEFCQMTLKPTPSKSHYLFSLR